MWILACLAIGGMLLFMLFRRNKFHIPLFKTICIFVLLVLLGVFSTYLLFFIENGKWGGMSFFGAVLFVPLWFIGLAKLFKITYPMMMDFVAPPGLLMFAVLKINCAVTGCCQGRMLWYSAENQPIFFPSPIVETITTILLVGALLYVERKGKTENKLYPISLVAYGVLRFILNFFRAPENPFLFGLQKGNVWALVAIISGMTWLLWIRYMEINEEYSLMMEEQKEA